MSTRGNKNGSRGGGGSRGRGSLQGRGSSGNGPTIRSTNVTNTALAQDFSQEDKNMYDNLKKKITSYLMEVWKRKICNQTKKLHNYLPRPSYQKKMARMEENRLDRLTYIIGSGGYHSGNRDSFSNFLRNIKRNHVEEYSNIFTKVSPKSSLNQSSMILI
ncbi:hypothetical protein OUZ56_029936 [Daphnia magna]|uniref:Uncharacterized protein n=1 Tax=Daphnia magna TaxID=35525 RepID=A0ABR0B889_9CRUS|nr:hypothetical protein OUZ56_029936 [Daphnia magna]